MTKKRMLFTAALWWMAAHVVAQHPMYVCTTTGCDAFDMMLMRQVTFHDDSIRVGRFPAYAVQQIDSIVFTQPQTEVHKLGWWGQMTDGVACYEAQQELHGYQYEVRFTIHAEAGVCKEAKCELHFAEQWMTLDFLELEEVSTDTNSDPYIYVKATQTGPRRYEVWVMGNPVLPQGGVWQASDDMLTLTKDCAEWLAERPMAEVRQIVEAWVHQQAVRIDLHNGHDDEDQD